MPPLPTSRQLRRTSIGLGVAALAIMLAVPSALAGSAKTKRVNVSSGGAEADRASTVSSISANGRFVAIWSGATNLTSVPLNGDDHIFVRDRRNRKTRLVSVTSKGIIADDGASDLAISGNGRWVAFASGATNLVFNDSNAVDDIFVRDRERKKTRRVSVRSNGAQATGASSQDPAISLDGRYVAFWSGATDLIGTDANGKFDVFVHDRKTKKTKRVSVRSNGAEGNDHSSQPSISANGRFVAFRSRASNFVKGDNNGKDDIFVHDRKTKKTKRVSVRSNGAEANGSSDVPSISGNGRYVAFESGASNLVKGDGNAALDIFVHDRRTKKTKRVSVKSNGVQGALDSVTPSISGGGRYLAFTAESKLTGKDTNGDDDVYVHDRKTRKTRLVSVRNGGGVAEPPSFFPSISADGRFVTFASDGSNLIGSDTNNVADIFIRGPLR